MNYADTNSRSHSHGQVNFLERLPQLLIPACVLFNFCLCIINTKLFRVDASLIIVCELVFIGTALLYGFFHLDKAKLYWVAVMMLQVIGLVALSIAKHEFLMKPIRDVIILPIFVIAGLSAYRVEFTKTLVLLTFLVLIIGIIEAVYLDQYLDIVNIKSYYISKGTESDFTYTESNLFVSGIRPNGRFLFDVPGLHRVSSVFLEPVSLGFFAFISFLYFSAVKDRISKRVYYMMMLVCLTIIWLGDARMAFGSMVLMIFMRPIFLRLDHRLSVFVSPMIFTIFFLLFHYNLMSTEGEGIGARVSSTLGVVELMDLDVFLGVSKLALYPRDSALAELMVNHGLFGFLIYWLSPIFFLRKASPEARIYLFGVSIFICQAYLLSAAIFTIKTAALLWFIYGYLIVRYRDDDSNEQIIDNIADPSHLAHAK